MAHNSVYFEEEQLGTSYDVKMLKWLYPLTKPYRALLAGSIFLVVLITLLDIAVPYVTKIAIDRYIVPQAESVEKAYNAAGDHKIRYLAVNITDAHIRAIVGKYPHLFTLEGKTALISYTDLPKLERNDIIVLRRSDIAGIAFIAAIFLALIVANFFFNFVQVMIMEYVGQMIMHDLRVRLFDHIQKLSVAFFTLNPVGRLVTRVTNDTQNMHELFTSIVAFVFKDIFLLIGITIVLLTINWKLTLISFMVLPVVFVISIHFSVKARDVYRILRVKIAEINTRFSETIGGIKVIQLFRQEQANYDGFENLNHENYMAGMKQIHIYALFMPIIELLSAVALAVVIFYGGRRVLADSISLGALVAFISYMRMFFRPIRDIAEKYNIMQNALASAERIYLIFNTEEADPEPVDGGISEPSDLRIQDIAMEDVSFSYVENESVLKHISFHVKAGETIAFVGPTGSGKTTVVNLLTRFYEHQSGRILINGRDITAIETRLLRSRMALVTQDPFLFSGTSRENIISGNGNISDDALNRILEASNCKSMIDRLPDGVDTELSEGGASISSGERQLISIARAFARDPDLIILDEATSYIDSETELKIQEALGNLMKDRTAIIVAHRLSTARSANRILVLHRHRIIEEGTHDELMDRKGFYFKLQQLQN
ncbi:MAG: ABC transporter ATP-binding protein/permease [Deltaproteobacteria bacterium]|nr:ABC transporter ATP-binding protein/permease [Deltaproteobacteria bacterium]